MNEKEVDRKKYWLQKSINLCWLLEKSCYNASPRATDSKPRLVRDKESRRTKRRPSKPKSKLPLKDREVNI